MSRGGHVSDIDKGLKGFLLQMRKAAAESGGVKVGVFDTGARGADGVTNVQLAAIHEFGAPSKGIPETRFLRGTMDANQAKYVKMEERLALQVIDGKLEPKAALELLGQQAVADVKARVVAQTGMPALKPETIKRKGSSKRLIDTGQLLGSITYQLTEETR
jgi:phage gpG-like protein